MRYRVRISATTKRNARSLPGHIRQRVWRLIEALAGEARPLGAKELRGDPGIYRLRLESWRIIYRVLDGERCVDILDVRRKAGPETYENPE